MTNKIFSGGLSTRLAPYLIDSSSAIEYTNINNENGSLTSELGIKNTNIESKKRFYHFKNCDKLIFSDLETHWAELDNRLYSTENGKFYIEECNGNKVELSISNDSNKPNLETIENGNLNGKYRYSYSYYNSVLDIESIPTKLSDLIDTNIGCREEDKVKDIEEFDIFYARLMKTRFILEEALGSDSDKCLLAMNKVRCLLDDAYENEQLDAIRNSISVASSNTDCIITVSTPDGDTEVIRDECNCMKLMDTLSYIYSSNYLFSKENSYKSLYTRLLAISKSEFSEEYKKFLYMSTIRAISDSEELYDIKYKTRCEEILYLISLYNGSYYLFDLKDSDLPISRNITCRLNNWDMIDNLVKTNDTEEKECSFKNIKVTNIVKSNEEQVDKIRLYRIGGESNNYTLVDTLDNIDQDYIDSKSDSDIAGNHILDSLDNYKPKNGKYITESNSMLFAASGNNLIFSNVGKPEAWPPTNFIKFPNKITGIGETQNGILIFTEYKTYIVVGNSHTTLSMYLLSGEFGCINHDSIIFIDNKLLWLSKYGICASNGGNVKLITNEKLGKIEINNSINAVNYNNMYILSTDSESLILDNRYGFIIRKYRNLGYLGIYKNKVLTSLYGNLHSLFNGNKLQFKYISPIFTHGRLTSFKSIKDIFIAYDGVFNIKIIAHSNKGEHSILDKDLPETDKLFNLKTDGRFKVYGIQFKIVGIGTIKEISFNVKEKE